MPNRVKMCELPSVLPNLERSEHAIQQENASEDVSQGW